MTLTGWLRDRIVKLTNTCKTTISALTTTWKLLFSLNTRPAARRVPYPRVETSSGRSWRVRRLRGIARMPFLESTACRILNMWSLYSCKSPSNVKKAQKGPLIAHASLSRGLYKQNCVSIPTERKPLPSLHARFSAVPTRTLQRLLLHSALDLGRLIH